MAAPPLYDLRADNRQLTQIQALGLSGPDQASYIAALQQQYAQQIADATINAPGNLAWLYAELNALNSQTPAQLASYPPRPGVGSTQAGAGP
jgi:hypothetical protein